MSGALEAIRAERASLLLQVHQLDCAESLLSPSRQPTVYDDPAPERNGSTRATGGGSKGQNPTRAQLREHIVAHAPIGRRELLVAFGGSPNAIDNKLRKMLDAGEIGADGRPGARLYRAPDGPATPPRPEIVVSGRAPERGVYPVYDVIVDRNGATTEQISRQTGLPRSVVVEQGRRLIQLGLVRFTGAGRTRKWLPVKSERRRDAA
jgi:hypothetical protein